MGEIHEGFRSLLTELRFVPEVLLMNDSILSCIIALLLKVSKTSGRIGFSSENAGKTMLIQLLVPDIAATLSITF